MKRQGWKYESWRHSLAAKGIKTNPSYFKKKFVSESDMAVRDGSSILSVMAPRKEGDKWVVSRTRDVRSISTAKGIPPFGMTENILGNFETREEAMDELKMRQGDSLMNKDEFFAKKEVKRGLTDVERHNS